MPIMDKELLFGEAIDLGSTSASANVSGTDVIYIPLVTNPLALGSTMQDRPNVSRRLTLNIVVEDEDILASSTSATITCRLYNHTGASSISSAGDQILEKAITIPAASTTFPDGTWIMRQPLPGGQLKAYFGVNFAVTTKKILTGKVTAWLGLDTNDV